MHTGRRITRLPDESLREGLKIAPLQLIIDTVLEHESASWDDVRQGTRRLPILMCRHMIHYLASISEERTFFEIAAIFQLDHATAMNSRNVVENLFETNHEFKLKLIKKKNMKNI